MASGPHLIIDITRKQFTTLPAPLMLEFKLDVAPSSVVALVGPSGVGKSTLLRLVAGVDRDYEGRIVIDGTDAASAPPPGFVFQDPRLLPWLTAEDNLRAVRADLSREAARTLLARVGLAAYATSYPHQLSGGMQRRVALARALAVNPQLLLLDEPFVSLDRTLVGELQQLFIDLFAETHPTVLLVTHLAEDAARLADRAVLLDGRPLRIVGDIALSGQRGVRSAAEIDTLTHLITAPHSEALT